jgi:hypothetical protein
MMNLKYKKKNHRQMNSRMNNRLNKTFCSMIILSLRSGYIYRKRERDWIDNDSWKQLEVMIFERELKNKIGCSFQLMIKRTILDRFLMVTILIKTNLVLFLTIQYYLSTLKLMKSKLNGGITRLLQFLIK